MYNELNYNSGQRSYKGFISYIIFYNLPLLYYDLYCIK